MSQTQTQEENIVSLNTPITESINRRIRFAAVTLGLNLQRTVKFLYTLALYVQENFGVQDTKKLSRTSYPVVCLTAAKNDLTTQGCPQQTLDKLVEVIVETEDFLAHGKIPSNED
jgi:hypothetical protein